MYINFFPSHIVILVYIFLKTKTVYFIHICVYYPSNTIKTDKQTYRQTNKQMKQQINKQTSNQTTTKDEGDATKIMNTLMLLHHLIQNAQKGHNNW